MKVKFLNLDDYDFGGQNIVLQTFETLNKYIEKFGERTIVITQVGEFAEVYAIIEENENDESKCFGSHLVEFGELCALCITDKKQYIKNKSGSKRFLIVFAGFKHCYIEKNCNRLKNKNFTIIRVDQERSGAGAPRSVFKIYSPLSGDLEDTFSSSSSNYENGNISTNIIVSIWIEYVKKDNTLIIGISSVDNYTGKSTIFEYTIEYIHNSITFDELEKNIRILNPFELIIISSLEEGELYDIIKFLRINDKIVLKINLKTSKKIKNCYKQTYQKKILEKFFGIYDINNYYLYSIATQSFCYLLDFIYETNPDLTKKIKEPIFDNKTNHILLANHSLVQLNIINDGKYIGKYSSIVNMLNECFTCMGKRKLYTNLLNPISDIEELNTSYDIVEYIKNLLTSSNEIKKIKYIEKENSDIKTKDKISTKDKDKISTKDKDKISTKDKDSSSKDKILTIKTKDKNSSKDSSTKNSSSKDSKIKNSSSTKIKNSSTTKIKNSSTKDSSIKNKSSKIKNSSRKDIEEENQEEGRYSDRKSNKKNDEDEDEEDEEEKDEEDEEKEDDDEEEEEDNSEEDKKNINKNENSESDKENKKHENIKGKHEKKSDEEEIDFDLMISYLKTIKDLQKFLRQLVLCKITPYTLSLIYVSIKSSYKIFNLISKNKKIIEHLNKKNIFLNGDEFESILEYLKETFDLKKCKDIKSFNNFTENIIMKGVNEELDKILENHLESSDKLIAIKKYLNIFMNEFIGKKETEYIKLYEQPKKGTNLSLTKIRSTYLINAIESTSDKSVKLKYLSSYDNENKKIKLNLSTITLITHSKNIIFIDNPEINEILNDMNELKTEVNEIISKVYLKCIKKLDKNFSLIIEKISEFIGELDFIICKALVANKFNYCKPIIKNDCSTKSTDNSFKNDNLKTDSNISYISTKNLRHPLIECLNTKEFYISNNIELNSFGMLLYGTNAVGKSSLIKSIGIAVILAQAGFFVPASEFIYYPYKKIFTRIIGNDNLFENNSSFAVEILELKTILNLMDSNSLILGDELAKGTEIESAEAICTQGYIELANAKSSFIFATHLHTILKFRQIKDLIREEKLFIKHMTVIYNNESNKLVYNRKLIYGSGPGIYGLEVCKSMGLPLKFIENCNKIRLENHPESSSILDKKVSKYNSNKIREICEKCKKECSTETHHIHKQKNADENGFITTKEGITFHKNHTANLLVLCEKCHLEEHS